MDAMGAGGRLEGSEEGAAAPRGAPRDAMTVVREFLHALGQAVKSVALYSSIHPVPVAAMRDCRKALAELFARMQWRQAAFTLVEGRWVVNGMVVGDSHLSDSLAAVFGGRPFDVVSFLAGMQPYELEAFCELAALPTTRLSSTDPAEYLRRKDVVHVHLEGIRFATDPTYSQEAPPAAPAPSPAPAPARPAPAPRKAEAAPWGPAPRPEPRRLPPGLRREPERPASAVPPKAAPPPASPPQKAPPRLAPALPAAKVPPAAAAPAPVPAKAAPVPAPAAPLAPKVVEGPAAGPGPGGAPASPRAGAGTAPSAAEGAGPGGKGAVTSSNFGAILKSLVEDAVTDPEERVRIYTEAVTAIKGALEHRVAERTKHLQQEAKRVLDERIRTEEVLSTLAEGKVVVDRDGRVLMMDPAAERITGRKLVDIAGKPILESVDTVAGMVSLARSIGEAPTTEDARKLDVVGVDEVTTAFRSSMALLQNDEGRVIGTYGVLPAAAKYREAAKLQEDFISQVTHELKAPLASMRSALELVEQLASSKLGTQEKRFLEISRDNSIKLGRMIDEMLDFSKIQAGKFVLHPEPMPVAAAVREAADGLRPWALSRKLDLQVALDGLDDLTAMGDRARVVQVLTNLLSNAIKSTPEGGSIRVSAAAGGEAHPGQVVFSVKDTGCGIAPEDQERIFQKFVQVTPKGQRREGVGLGLSIVRELVARQQGILWLESEPGRGTTFSFTLPLASEEPAAHPLYAELNAQEPYPQEREGA